MIPIYVMAEHPGQADELKAALAQPACAGLMVRPAYADIAGGNYAETDAMTELAVAAGKMVHFGLSPLPMMAGEPCLTLDGEPLPIAWDTGYLDDCEAVLNLLSAHLTRAGWWQEVHGIRCAFTTAVDGDCELGFRFSPPGGGSASYLQNWLDAGLSSAVFTAAATRHAHDLGAAFPGKDISLSVLDPLDWRIGPTGVLPKRDHGATAKAINARVVAALEGSGCTFTAFNTNFRTDLPAATMLYMQALSNGRFGLQLADLGTSDADFVALAKAAIARTPIRLEVHQRQATPGFWTGLAG